MNFDTPLYIYQCQNNIEDDQILTIQEFKAGVECGGFIDYDGFGYAVKNNMVDTHRSIYPSKVHYIPDNVTHIIWFNR